MGSFDSPPSHRGENQLLLRLRAETLVFRPGNPDGKRGGPGVSGEAPG